MRFDYIISHVPGKYMYTADILSCNPTIVNTSLGNVNLNDIEPFVQIQVESLSVRKDRQDIYHQAQLNNLFCSQVNEHCQSSLPQKCMIQFSLKPYWNVRGELTVCNNPF